MKRGTSLNNDIYDLMLDMSIGVLLTGSRLYRTISLCYNYVVFALVISASFGL